MDVAASTWDPELRKRMLTFIFVGGGFAGIEALAEVEDMARDATVQYYKAIEQDELRFVLVEGAGPHPARGQRADGRVHPRAS